MSGRSEAQARIKINQLLGEAGWRFFDSGNSKANVILENNVKITKSGLDSYGNNFEKVPTFKQVSFYCKKQYRQQNNRLFLQHTDMDKKE
ncbi:MAG TPA: hypothetical protein PKY46_10835 [Ignavibacteriaceae bacterium]|nr:hypothetical protein [Ignavibacteriaceae bacterium]